MGCIVSSQSNLEYSRWAVHTFVYIGNQLQGTCMEGLSATLNVSLTPAMDMGTVVTDLNIRRTWPVSSQQPLRWWGQLQNMSTRSSIPTSTLIGS